MPGETITNNGKKFLNIKEGFFREKSQEGVEGAVRRDFTNPKTGDAGHVWEIPYNSWTGIVESVQIKELEFGKILEIDMGDAVLNFPVGKRYFPDMASKLPSIDLKKEVTITPYDFEAEGKKRIGVSVKQGEEKLRSYFYDGKKNLHGMPTMEEKKPDGDDWKMFFMGVDKFLVKYIQKNFTDDSGFVEDKKATAEDLPF